MYTKEYFQKIYQEEYLQARRLAEYLYPKYLPRTVVDFGCADGLYIKPFNDKGCYVLGIDSAPVLVSMKKVDNIILSDLRMPYKAGKFDLALCLEVLEHIEERYTDNVIQNLVDASDLLLVSAAVPGQEGEGHVNLQHKKYWIDKFDKHGYILDNGETKELVDYMKEGYHLGWFVENAMILRR